MLSLQPGQKISQYELIEKIGQGGMGVVWMALDTELKRRVAIKFLPTALSPESGRRLRFKREAQTAAALDHPHIAVIHEVGELEGHPFIVMQLMEGKSLRSMMVGQPLPLLQWVRLAIPMAEALAYAHRHGIVHRDLKPDNIMMTAEGLPKIVDFGLAKLFNPGAFGSDDQTRRETLERDLTRVGEVFGTFSYMSPEQARGDPLDHRSDIFSMGVILYEMAGGRRPFEAGNPAGTLAAIVSSDPQPLTALAPGTDPEADRIIRKSLEKTPDLRYQDADELAADLKNLRAGLESGHVSGPVLAAARPFPRWVLPLVAALSVILAGLIALWEPRVTVTTATSPQPGVHTPATKVSIAVVGFENLTDPEDPRSLGRILMGLITTDLTESGGLSVSSTSKVMAARKSVEEADGDFDFSQASRVAEEVGAQVMLVGQVAETEETLLLTAELVDVASGESLKSITQEVETREDFFQMAGAVAEAVRSHLAVTGSAGTAAPFDLAKALTSSPEAYQAYAEGERAFQQLGWGEAAGHFKEAVEIDPSFALAYYRAGMAYAFVGRVENASAMLSTGLEHLDRLPARWQTIHRALLTWLEGRTHDAFVPLSRLIASSPAIPDAYYLLGEIRTHSSRHYDPARARQLFARARELDPSFVVVNDHLIDAYLADGDLEAATALMEEARQRGEVGAFSRESELKLLAAEGRFEELSHRADEMMEELDGEGGDIWTWIIDGHLHLGDFDRALELAGRAAETKRGRQLPSALIKKGQALTGMGRLSEALAAFRRAQTETDGIPPRIREFGTQGHRYATGILAAAGELEEAIRETRTAIEKDPYAPEWRHLLGRLLLQAGRPVEAAEELGRLRAISAGRLSPPAVFWEAALQLEVFLSSGDLDGAKSELRKIFAMRREHRDAATEWQLRTLVAREDGDTEAAIKAGEAYLNLREDLPGASVCDKTLMLFDLARLEEARGTGDAALVRYRELLRRWGSADLPVAVVEEARRRAAALGG